MREIWYAEAEILINFVASLKDKDSDDERMFTFFTFLLLHENTVGYIQRINFLRNNEKWKNRDMDHLLSLASIQILANPHYHYPLLPSSLQKLLHPFSDNETESTYLKNNQPFQQKYMEYAYGFYEKLSPLIVGNNDKIFTANKLFEKFQDQSVVNICFSDTPYNIQKYRTDKNGEIKYIEKYGFENRLYKEFVAQKKEDSEVKIAFIHFEGSPSYLGTEIPSSLMEIFDIDDQSENKGHFIVMCEKLALLQKEENLNNKNEMAFLANELGNWYSKGYEVEKSYQKALHFYRLAKSYGSKDAEKNLSEMYGEKRPFFYRDFFDK